MSRGPSTLLRASVVATAFAFVAGWAPPGEARVCNQPGDGGKCNP